MQEKDLQEIRFLVPGFLGRLLEVLAKRFGDREAEIFLSDFFGFQRCRAGFRILLGGWRLCNKYYR